MEITKDSGIAMLFALFALIVVSGISVVITGLGSQAAYKSQSTIKRAQSAAAVEGAIHAIFPILHTEDLSGVLTKYNGTFAIPISEDTINVHIADACTRWDINEGDPAILKSLLKSLNIADPNGFIDTLTAIRKTGNGFEHISQLRAVPGLDQPALERLTNETTIYCRTSNIERNFSSKLMQRALTSLSYPIEFASPGKVFRISASNTYGPGSFISIVAHVEVFRNPERPIKILDWDSNE